MILSGQHTGTANAQGTLRWMLTWSDLKFEDIFCSQAYLVLIQCLLHNLWSSVNGRVKLMPVSPLAWHHLESTWSASGSHLEIMQVCPCHFFLSLEISAISYWYTELQHIPEYLLQGQISQSSLSRDPWTFHLNIPEDLFPPDAPWLFFSQDSFNTKPDLKTTLPTPFSQRYFPFGVPWNRIHPWIG